MFVINTFKGINLISKIISKNDWIYLLNNGNR